MSPVGTVYLLHFAEAIGNSGNTHGTARHYIGWAANLDARIADHRSGRGARITAHLAETGIGFDVVRTWDGVPRAFERRLKNTKRGPRFCPVCTTHPAQPPTEVSP